MKSKEAQLQSSCVTWFRLQYPKLSKLLISVPNGGSRNVIEAANLKRQGLVSGVADLILFVPANYYHGLCIEMKYGPGKQSPNQKEWQEAVEKQGYLYIICRSFDEFKDEIENYLLK